MGLNLKGQKNSKMREQQPLPEKGVRPARLMYVVDLGVQYREPYKGKEKPPIQQIHLGFDLVDDLYVFNEELGPQPFRRSPWPLNVSIDPDTGLPWKNSNLYTWWKAVDPEDKYDLDFKEMLTAPCFVTVTHDEADDGFIYANIGDPAPMPNMPGFKIAESTNEPFYFELPEPENVTEEDINKFNSLPEYIREIIKKAVNFPDNL